MDLFKSLKGKAQIARKLNFADGVMLTEAWWRLLYFHIALRAISYERLENSARAEKDSPAAESRALGDAEHIQMLIHYAARLHLISMTCLVKSLTLQKMLDNRNISAQIRIGAQKIQNKLYAHAWVEVHGEAIGEPSDIAQKFNILKSAVELNSRQFT